MGAPLPQGALIQIPQDVLDSLFYHTLIMPCTLVGFYTLLWYDYFSTMEEELKCIWGRPMSTGKVLLIVNRYLPFCDATMMMSLVFQVHTGRECHLLAGVVTWLIFIGSAASEMILMLRTLAIWQRNRWVLRLFCLLVFGMWPICIWLVYKETSKNIYDTEGGIGRCISHEDTHELYIPYALLMVSETIIVVLTTVKAWQHLPKSHSAWVHQLYRDGLLFYFYVLCISTLNMAMISAGPVYYKSWLVLPQRIVHSVLCNRVLFFLLDPQVARRKEPSDRVPISNQGRSSVINSVVVTGAHGEVTTRTFNINDDLFLEEMGPRLHRTSTSAESS